MSIKASVLKALCKLIPKDNSKYTLTGVHTTDHAVEATDGIILCKVKVAENLVDGVFPLSTLPKTTKSDKFKGRLELVTEGTDSNVLIVRNANGDMVTSKALDGTFPKTEKYFLDGEPILQVKFNPSSLRKLLAVFEADQKGVDTFEGTLGVTFAFYDYSSMSGKYKDSYQAVLHNGDITGVIVPVLEKIS